jgi:DNA polymerase-3 subunit delta'
MNYFWLDKHVKQWNASITHDHKPQAVIVSGNEGIGKTELLNQVMADLICRKISPGHCGECQNCTLFKQGYHPDIHRIEPEKNVVKVKMIRELTEFFTSTPHCSDYKIAVINQADYMNVAAANALLKILEEPPSRGILFLITNSKHQLMPTIKSRCISLDVVISNTEKSQLSGWLQAQTGEHSAADMVVHEQSIKAALILTDYQPISALNLLQNNQLDEFTAQLDALYTAFNQDASVSVVAKQIIDNQSSHNWALLQRYFLQLLKSGFSPNQHEIFHNHPLNQLIKKSPKVIHIIIKITELIEQFMLNLNTQIKDQLLLESMLVEIKNEFSHGR